jgi:hypothetical protein
MRAGTALTSLIRAAERGLQLESVTLPGSGVLLHSEGPANSIDPARDKIETNDGATSGQQRRQPKPDYNGSHVTPASTARTGQSAAPDSS